ncbi:hypothetical protein K7432_008958, partial [Basidiobolus ranarum]
MKLQYIIFALLALSFVAYAAEPIDADLGGGLTVVIITALVKAGLRLAKTQTSCQACKGLCNRIFSGSVRDT